MLDGILERLGLIRLRYYDSLKELYVEEQTTRANLQTRCNALQNKYDVADFEGKARYASPDGKKVLKDLQRALNYLKGYQRALWVGLLPDNNFYLVKDLLKAWGMEPDENVNDHMARAIPGIPKTDRTGQPYDGYGIKFEDVDPDDTKFKTDVTVTGISPIALLESSNDD